ncbi:MAG TPA: DUF502 domain-containing protein [Beijerinckiaceae bacterium]|jgi:uncharacterized membrane protein
MTAIDPRPAAAQPQSSRHWISARARIRNYFLTGLIVAGPVAITIYLAWWFIQLVDSWVKPFVPSVYLPETYLPFTIPGFGLVVAFVGLTLLGFLTANLVGKSLVNLGEVVLDRMPVVRGLYKGVKQIFETVFKQDGHSFRQVGLIEWPGEGLWSLCFITEPAQGALAASLPAEEHVCVFVPCTPNPTTGYLVIMERSRVKEIDVTTDEAFKLLMSMGIIQPDHRAPLPGVPRLAGEPPAAVRPAREIAGA